MTLRDRLERAQSLLNLNSQQLATAVRITPEWLSKIMNGKAAGSEDIGLRLDDMLRRRGIDPASIAVEVGSATGVAESASPYGGPEVFRREMREHVDATIAAAGDDVGRLGYLREKLREHFNPPAHWSSARGQAPNEDEHANPAVRAAVDAGRRKGFKLAAKIIEEAERMDAEREQSGRGETG